MRRGMALVMLGPVMGLLLSTCSDGGGRHRPVPAITLVVPLTGQTSGGEPAEVHTTGFRDDFSSPPLVYFGPDPATVTGVSLGRTISVLTPPSAMEGVVDVRVEGTGRTPPETAVLVGGFTYDDIPEIVLVSPDRGILAGGTTVTIQTASFRDDFTVNLPRVVFGGTLSLNVSPLGPDTVTAVTPSRSPAEAVDVGVESSGVLELAVRTGGYLYVDCPAVRLSCDITGANPDNGPVAGGNSIILTGGFFCDLNPQVTFGFGGPTVAASFVSNQELTVIVPPALAPGPVELLYGDDVGCFAVPVPFCCYTYN